MGSGPSTNTSPNPNPTPTLASTGGRGNASAAAQKSSKRLLTELADINRGLCPPGITAGPTGDNIYKWKGTIRGPKGSPYEGGLFSLDINIPTAYPFVPPKIKFVTKIYHCNINQTGSICLDILNKGTWSPALNIASALLSISSLLTDPNPDGPIGSASQLYTERREDYDRIAKDWTKRFAK